MRSSSSTFNDEYYLDQDFTANITKLAEGLEKIESRGGTALYDAVVASADHLKKNAKLDKKVLLVVTDGEDNASRESAWSRPFARLQAKMVRRFTPSDCSAMSMPEARTSCLTDHGRTIPAAFHSSRKISTKWTRSLAKSPTTSATSTPSAINRPSPQRPKADIRTVSVEAKAPAPRQAGRPHPHRILLPGRERGTELIGSTGATSVGFDSKRQCQGPLNIGSHFCLDERATSH